MKIISKIIAAIMDRLAPTEPPVSIEMHCQIFMDPARPAIWAKLDNGHSYLWIWDVGREQCLRKRITREAARGRISWYHAACLIREVRSIQAMVEGARYEHKCT